MTYPSSSAESKTYRISLVRAPDMLQVVGFLVILSGSSLYNELIRICLPNTALTDETTEAEVRLSKR